MPTASVDVIRVATPLLLSLELPICVAPSKKLTVPVGVPLSNPGCACLLYTSLNPIEKLFAKLKTLLRKAAKRSEELWKEIGELLNTVTTSECANYFASSGYVIT